MCLYKMSDVVTVQLENENLRKVRSRLLQWETKSNYLAALNSKQDEYMETINTICSNEMVPQSHNNNATRKLDESNVAENENVVTCNSMERLKQQDNEISTAQDFLVLYEEIANDINGDDDMPVKYYLKQLLNRRSECVSILTQIEQASQYLQTLKNEYKFVSEKTQQLNEMSEQLIKEQKILQNITEDVQQRLYYYNQVDVLNQRLFSPTLSVTSDAFQECLCKIDECLSYLNEHPQNKETPVYTVRYKHCLNKAITLLRTFVYNVMNQCTKSVLHPKQMNEENSSMENDISEKNSTATTSDTVFALYYGKYQILSVKIKRIIQMIELRVPKCPEYLYLLNDIQQHYVQQRSIIMKPAVDKAINDIQLQHKSDHCALMRSACAFLLHLCQDEYRLYYQFFVKDNEQLNIYLEGLCNILYDMLRPFIIHINHLETLAEICSILRIEMLEEHVKQNPIALDTFATIVNQLLQDVQERLVFRAYLYLQSDILNYNPSAGDLAYPEKLEMMESIALSLQESSKISRSESRSSLTSSTSNYTGVESAKISQGYLRTMNSPADVHGMWYPTVRRTLVCLSRLYRCVDRPIFQGLSQEALKYCIQSVAVASNKISQTKTPIDGELFEIKHMLILREQIAPFRVDFTVKETSLDFSNVKTAAFGLLQKRNQLFSIGSNNALLEFLLEGTPQIKEHMLDSRKAVDRQLKLVCERFIEDAVQELIGPLLKFLERIKEFAGVRDQNNEESNASEKSKCNNLRQCSWASPQQISSVIQETQRLIKKRLPSLQYSMQLYLSNRDTEFILFRPIRNKIILSFMKLQQLLAYNSYSSDDMIIASCPSTEQVSLLLSNISYSGVDKNRVRRFSQQQDKMRNHSNETNIEVNAGENATQIALENKIVSNSQSSIMEHTTESYNIQK